MKNAIEKALSYEVLGFACVFVTRHQNFPKVAVKEHKKYLTPILERPNLLFGIVSLNLCCSLTVICVRFDRARLLKAIVALLNCFGAGTHIRVFIMR